MDITKINNYKDLFLDINKFDEDNMSYIKPILFYKVIRHMGVYYKKNEKKQKMIIQTPKMVVPFGVKEFTNGNKKSYQASLSFTTMTNLYNEEEIKKFYYFMKRIDTVNEDTIMEYRKEWGLPKKLTYRKTLQRLSADYPHHMNINLPHDEKMGFLFNVYDEKAEKANIDIIEKKSIVSVVMELTDLRFTDTEFRANWTVLQIRKFKPYSPIQDFFMSGCYIVDNDDPQDKVYAKIIEEYQKKLAAPLVNHTAYHSTIVNNIQPVHHNSTNNNEKSSTVIFKPPTLSELLDAKKTLKKTVTVEKIKPQGKVLDESEIPPPPPPPPPVKNNTTVPENNPKKVKDIKKKSVPKKTSAANA